MAKKNNGAGAAPALSRTTIAFFKGLERNNNKAWFDAHRGDYKSSVLDPLSALVAELGAAMDRKLPQLRYDPRVNGSIFRINRDTRFSNNKQPYKTHAGALWWLGPGHKLESASLYVQIDAKTLFLGTGAYMFAKTAYEPYRAFVAGKGGARLATAVARAQRAGWEPGGGSYVRVPAGFPPDHPRADLLKRKGFYVTRSYPVKETFRDDLAEWLVREFAPTLDVARELQKALG